MHRNGCWTHFLRTNIFVHGCIVVGTGQYLVDDEAEELAGARAGGEADGIVHLSASCGKGGQRLHEKMPPPPGRLVEPCGGSGL